MLPLRRTTGGSTTAWEEFDKNRAFIRGKDKCRFETGKIAAEREKARGAMSGGARKNGQKVPRTGKQRNL